MIISASRRTDIPAYYADWFFQRLEDGFVYTRNLLNNHQVSRISLAPDVVDGVVFWTKNPLPMLDRLHLLDGYPFYFQFTLNAYGRDMECGLPDKAQVIIPTFQKLSHLIGPERVIWRYDPIVLTPVYTMEYHVQNFENIAKRLSGHTHRCVISFMDLYRHLGAAVRDMQMCVPTTKEIYELASRFSETACKYHLSLETCAETVELSQFGIGHGCCIDSQLLEKVIGRTLYLKKDQNQRKECGCAESIDIGMYDSCSNGCKYCYANHSLAAIQRNIAKHDPALPLLYGSLASDDVVKNRKVETCRVDQLAFF